MSTSEAVRSVLCRLSSRTASYLLHRRLRRVATFAGAPVAEVAGWEREWHSETAGDTSLDMELYLLVRAARPGRVVETGVNRGRSTAAILRALEHNGNGGALTSIDLPTTRPEGRLNADGKRDRAWVPEGMTGCEVPEYLRSRWTLRLGDARDLLPREEPGYGFFFHDSDHSYEHQSFEYAEALNALAPGGTLASDDIGWSGAWVNWTRRLRPSFVWSPTRPIRGAAKVPVRTPYR